MINEIKRKGIVTVKLIDGHMHRIDSESVCGFCRYKLHRGYLSIALLKQHECLEKKCAFLYKLERCPFWERLEHKLQEKKENKIKKAERLELEKQKKLEIEQKCNEVAEFTQRFLDKTDLNTLVIRVIECKSSSGYIINFVSDRDYDDNYAYENIEQIVADEFGCKIQMRHIRTPEGAYLTHEDLWMLQR